MTLRTRKITTIFVDAWLEGVFANLATPHNPPEVFSQEVEEEPAPRIPLSIVADLPYATYHGLRALGVEFLDEVSRYTQEELESINGVSEWGVDRLRETLRHRGMWFSMESRGALVMREEDRREWNPNDHIAYAYAEGYGGLTGRMLVLLQKNGISTLGQLAQQSRESLSAIPFCGWKTIKAIERVLECRGKSLRKEEAETK